MTLIPIPTSPEIAATVARIALGALFLLHGLPKIRNVKAPMGWVRSTGFPGGGAFAVAFTLLEFFGGLALIAGFLTQTVAILIALEMVATSIFTKTKLGKKFMGGYELDVVYLVLAVAVAFLGPGPWSLDSILGPAFP